MFRARGRVLIGIVWVAGCAGGPHHPPPVAGASMESVAAAHGDGSGRPVFAFVADDRRLVLYGVDDEGALDESGHTGAKVFVFEDDRYLGTLDRAAALDYSACLAQPNATELLAARLRALVEEREDPLAQPQGSSTVGDLRCPKGRDGAPPVPDQAPSEGPMDAVKGIAAAAVVIPLSFVLAPFGLAWAGGAAAHDRPSLEAQERIVLGMPADQVAAIMGEATGAFVLAPAGTEVRYWRRSISPPFWVGLDDARVVWLRFDATDRWLNDVTKRLSAAATAPPQE